VFVDGGFGVDRDRPQSGDELVSVGPGVRWQPTQWARAEVYYGIALTDEPASRDALQDEGVHVLVRFSPPLSTWAQRFWD